MSHKQAEFTLSMQLYGHFPTGVYFSYEFIKESKPLLARIYTDISATFTACFHFAFFLLQEIFIVCRQTYSRVCNSSHEFYANFPQIELN